MYEEFCKYMDGFIGDRDHYQPQKEVVQNVLENLDVNSTSRLTVHDSACGTGEVLSLLKSNKKLDLSGSDASPGMLSVARDKNPEIQLTKVKFEELSDLKNKYNCIFCLGNSISHVSFRSF